MLRMLKKLSISTFVFWWNVHDNSARSRYQQDDPRVLLETSDTLVLQKPAGVEDGKQIWENGVIWSKTGNDVIIFR